MADYMQDQAMRRAVNQQRMLQGLPTIPDNMPVDVDARGFASDMPWSPFAMRPQQQVFPTPPGPVRQPDPLPAGVSRPPADIAPDIDWARVKHAIGGIESGGRKNPYATLGTVTKKGDVALGKYQIMRSNVPRWTREALGREMSPQEFLNSPEAQEKTFEHRFGNYIRKYGHEGAARAWYAGEKGMNNLNATDIHGRLTVANYGKDYLNRYGNAPATALAAAPPRPATDVSAQAFAPTTQPKAPAVAAIDQAIAPKPAATAPVAKPAAAAPAKPAMRWQGPLGEGDQGRYEEVGVAPAGGGLGEFFKNLFSPSPSPQQAQAQAPAAAPAAPIPLPRPRPAQADWAQPGVPDFGSMTLSPFAMPENVDGFPRASPAQIPGRTYTPQGPAVRPSSFWTPPTPPQPPIPPTPLPVPPQVPDNMQPWWGNGLQLSPFSIFNTFGG